MIKDTNNTDSPGVKQDPELSLIGVTEAIDEGWSVEEINAALVAGYQQEFGDDLPLYISLGAATDAVVIAPQSLREQEAFGLAVAVLRSSPRGRTGTAEHRRRILGEWARSVTSAAEAIEWIEFGFDPKSAVSWGLAGFDPEDAARWFDIGWNPKDAELWGGKRYWNDETDEDEWGVSGFEPEEVDRWVALFGKENFGDAKRWRNARCDPEDAARWIDAGFNSRDAFYWVEAGFDVDIARQCRGAGTDVKSVQASIKRAQRLAQPVPPIPPAPEPDGMTL